VNLFVNPSWSADDFFEQALANSHHCETDDKSAAHFEGLCRSGFLLSSACLYGDRWLLKRRRRDSSTRFLAAAFFLRYSAVKRCADALERSARSPRKTKRCSRDRAISDRAMDVYSSFVNAWYTKEFIEVFSHRAVLGLAPAVNAVLGGNVGNSFPIRWRMWVFYFLVGLQRHHPIAPKKPEEAPESPQTLALCHDFSYGLQGRWLQVLLFIPLFA